MGREEEERKPNFLPGPVPLNHLSRRTGSTGGAGGTSARCSFPSAGKLQGAVVPDASPAVPHILDAPPAAPVVPVERAVLPPTAVFRQLKNAGDGSTGRFAGSTAPIRKLDACF